MDDLVEQGVRRWHPTGAEMGGLPTVVRTEPALLDALLPTLAGDLTAGCGRAARRGERMRALRHDSLPRDVCAELTAPRAGSTTRRACLFRRHAHALVSQADDDQSGRGTDRFPVHEQALA
ncbi:hypothetical protein Q3V37_18985 [Micromonospora profundi]|uniref:Uncharacterized protein n=1 Tax=Micromonospora profundi TaxID=1420889 RepID=A0AAJ6HNV6_9ACTN|nr:hypothetical protein [Micromonospora profundi]WLS43487.1 hypothetical protein Q3V37_18985 [Micromonospora profundi]